MMKRKKLIWQLYPSYLLLALLALGATGWYASQSMRHYYLDQTRQYLMIQARVLISQLQPLMTPPNSAESNRIEIDRFCKTTAVTVPIRITVILNNGLVLGDSEAAPATMENHGNRPEIKTALSGQPGSALRFSETLNQRMMYVALPLSESNPQGVVRVSLAVTAVDKELRRLTLRLVAGALIIALITSLVCLIISKRISRPIEEMRKGADRFAGGDLNHRLEAPSTAELAGLAKAMNKMAEELENRIQAIIQQGKESETVLSSMLEGVLALDLEERITQLNGAAGKLFDVKVELLKGRSIQEVIRHRKVHEMISATLKDGKTSEKDVALFQNREQVLNIRCTPMLDTNGDRNGALLVINDVTRLRQLENLRRDFAANVSHEIKTPLTAIKGFVQTLLQGAVDNQEDRQRFLKIIHKHVNRLTAIVDELMELSRLENDREGIQLTTTGVSIQNMLASAVTLCRPNADAKQIAFDVQCPADLTAQMDLPLMEQAAVNLLDNAVKYSPPESRITIIAARGEKEITIQFIDNGLGIEEKHLPRLFERFYRVDKARSRQMGGTGLGLAIVKHIVQSHGGSIEVASTLGKGSVFTIHLPEI